jgi:hypothetical protein
MNIGPIKDCHNGESPRYGCVLAGTERALAKKDVNSKVIKTNQKLGIVEGTVMDDSQAVPTAFESDVRKPSEHEEGNERRSSEMACLAGGCALTMYFEVGKVPFYEGGCAQTNTEQDEQDKSPSQNGWTPVPLLGVKIRL